MNRRSMAPVAAVTPVTDPHDAALDSINLAVDTRSLTQNLLDAWQQLQDSYAISNKRAAYARRVAFPVWAVANEHNTAVVEAVCELLYGPAIALYKRKSSEYSKRVATFGRYFDTPVSVLCFLLGGDALLAPTPIRALSALHDKYAPQVTALQLAKLFHRNLEGTDAAIDSYPLKTSKNKRILPSPAASSEIVAARRQALRAAVIHLAGTEAVYPTYGSQKGDKRKTDTQYLIEAGDIEEEGAGDGGEIICRGDSEDVDGMVSIEKPSVKMNLRRRSPAGNASSPLSSVPSSHLESNARQVEDKPNKSDDETDSADGDEGLASGNGGYHDHASVQLGESPVNDLGDSAATVSDGSPLLVHQHLGEPSSAEASASPLKSRKRRYDSTELGQDSTAASQAALQSSIPKQQLGKRYRSEVFLSVTVIAEAKKRLLERQMLRSQDMDACLVASFASRPMPPDWHVFDPGFPFAGSVLPPIDQLPRNVVFILHHDNPPHWTFVHYDKQTGDFHHYDSAKNWARHREVCQIIKDKLVHRKSAAASPNSAASAAGARIVLESCPQQQDAHSCAIFVLDLLTALILNGDIPSSVDIAKARLDHVRNLEALSLKSLRKGAANGTVDTPISLLDQASDRDDDYDVEEVKDAQRPNKRRRVLRPARRSRTDEEETQIPSELPDPMFQPRVSGNLTRMKDGDIEEPRMRQHDSGSGGVAPSFTSPRPFSGFGKSRVNPGPITPTSSHDLKTQSITKLPSTLRQDDAWPFASSSLFRASLSAMSVANSPTTSAPQRQLLDCLDDEFSAALSTVRARMPIALAVLSGQHVAIAESLAQLRGKLEEATTSPSVDVPALEDQLQNAITRYDRLIAEHKTAQKAEYARMATAAAKMLALAGRGELSDDDDDGEAAFDTPIKLQQFIKKADDIAKRLSLTTGLAGRIREVDAERKSLRTQIEDAERAVREVEDMKSRVGQLEEQIAGCEAARTQLDGLTALLGVEGAGASAPAAI